MFVIRDEQIQSFIAKTDEELIDVIKLALGEANPTRIEGIDSSTLNEMIRTGIRRARGRELSRAEDIAAFVGVMFEIAPNFDEQAYIDTAFNNSLMDPSFRFYNLLQGAPDAAWEEAERNYTVDAWFAGEGQ